MGNYSPIHPSGKWRKMEKADQLSQQPMVGIKVQAGGDSHLMNFGALATPEDNIFFDVNDFDETIPGAD
jgi:uncharacterized protein (DUF2252 family)